MSKSPAKRLIPVAVDGVLYEVIVGAGIITSVKKTLDSGITRDVRFADLAEKIKNRIIQEIEQHD
jgi:hypothetical protein